MENINKINRRNFLKLSGLSGGGLILGFNWSSCNSPKDITPIKTMPKEWFGINAFLKIGDNGLVTIYSPNPEIGQNIKTSMPMIVAEELDVKWEDVIVEQAGLNTEWYSRQVAGGSQSIRHGWTSLRMAGATAKQMLINAAALKWGVEPSSCYASQGIITNANGDSFGYGEVVKEAAVLEVPENVELKESKDYKIIGQDIKNVDIQKIITGKPLFGLDYVTEEMVYASVLRPPSFGKKLVSFDAQNSKKINGVLDVLKFGDKIAVLGTNTWAAMKGKKALICKWTSNTKLESTKDHNKELLKILNGNKFKVNREDGNIEKAFLNSDKNIERTYESPFLPHNCMEPMNFYANVTSDKVHLVGPIQTPAWTASKISKLLDRKPEEIHLEMTRMGGGFGRRLYGDFAEEAAQISSLANKPVKVVFSREDDMAAGIYRPAIKYRIKASIKDGKITGYHLKEAAINGNMYGLIPNFFPAGCIPNYKVSTANYQSKITTGAWRAPYTNFLAFAEQSFFNELASELGKDHPSLLIELLQNVKGTKDERIQYSAERMEKTINLVVEKSNWGKSSEGIYQGFSAYYSHNTHVAEVADVEMVNGLPVVKKVTVAVDCGIVVNPLGAKNQVEGGVIDGIGHAMYGDFSFEEGTPQSVNFDTYRLIRMNETPQVSTYFVESDLSPTGLGEPGLPPAGGAVANAIKAATGNQLFKQPFVKELGFVESKILG